MSDNTSHQKLTLDDEINASVTLDSNAYHVTSSSDREFIRQALRRNEIDKQPFSVKDFKQLSKANFRQKILRNKHLIEIVKKGHPTLYKIKGVVLPGDSHRITLETMRVGIKFLDILESLRLQQPSIHDIKLQFKSDLHKHMVASGCSTNPSNHSIKAGFPCADNNLTVKILIYPETTQIDIGCTYKPLVYDFKRLLYLQELLAKISYHLSAITGYAAIPPVSEWVMTHYHFAKDGPTVNNQMFHVTIEELSGGLIRFYSKQMPDGSVIPRVEQVRTPRRSMSEELVECLEVST